MKMRNERSNKMVTINGRTQDIFQFRLFYLPRAHLQTLKLKRYETTTPTKVIYIE
jgi:hypothetical protein